MEDKKKCKRVEEKYAKDMTEEQKEVLYNSTAIGCMMAMIGLGIGVDADGDVVVWDMNRYSGKKGQPVNGMDFKSAIQSASLAMTKPSVAREVVSNIIAKIFNDDTQTMIETLEKLEGATMVKTKVGSKEELDEILKEVEEKEGKKVGEVMGDPIIN